MIDFSNKHILITGGDFSLLRGIMSRLQEGGATITLVHHNPDRVSNLANEFPVNTLILDWEKLENCGDQLADIGNIHGAIFCPHFHKTGAFLDTTSADWDDALDLNYSATVFLSQAVARHMIARENAGSLVFLTSVMALMPFVDSSIVGTTLAMLRPLVKMIGVDCGQYGIRANMIAMGWIDSESSQPHLNSHRDYIEQGIPLGKVGKPEQIGDVCAFLLSDRSQYMTGSVLTVDGGYTLTRSDGQSPYTPTIETSKQ